jgi:hypothetical protein
VGDALRVEQGFLRPLPVRPPNTDHHLEVRVTKDGFVRVGRRRLLGSPGLTGRRLQVEVSLTEVKVFHEHRQIACHHRSFVPADVMICAAHARALRLAGKLKAGFAQPSSSFGLGQRLMFARTVPDTLPGKTQHPERRIRHGVEQQILRRLKG